MPACAGSSLGSIFAAATHTLAPTTGPVAAAGPPVLAAAHSNLLTAPPPARTTQALELLYAILMLLVALVLVLAVCNCPGALTALLAVTNVYLVLFMVLPILYAVILLVLRDGCQNLETIVVNQVLTSCPSQQPYRNQQLPGGFHSPTAGAMPCIVWSRPIGAQLPALIATPSWPPAWLHPQLPLPPWLPCSCPRGGWWGTWPITI